MKEWPINSGHCFSIAPSIHWRSRSPLSRLIGAETRLAGGRPRLRPEERDGGEAAIEADEDEEDESVEEELSSELSSEWLDEFEDSSDDSDDESQPEKSLTNAIRTTFK